MATRVFYGIEFFPEILKRTIAGTFLWNFIKIGSLVSEKMFKINVNALTDAQLDGHTTDTRPWRKPIGLRPVELKSL